MKSRCLTVPLGDQAYPIHMGSGLLSDPEGWQKPLINPQILVVTNTIVAPLYLSKMTSAFAGRDVASLILPDGEAHKTLTTAGQIWDFLLEHRYARDCALVALGGGVIGDLTGFAAACYQRGVDFVQIPTTLLAQVDSSVGGKTGVNHRLGKNMIGAFHQPRCVVADTDTLTSLPARELRAGLAEVIKYGLIADREFFVWLEDHLDELLARQPSALIHAIATSCRIKADIVGADERETGVRALLNLGHTFGHAIETGAGYGVWLHGEAVAAGMLMAADLSCRMGQFDQQYVDRLRKLLARAGLPVFAPKALDAQRFVELMGMDKKVKAGRLRLIVMRGLGAAEVRGDVPESLLHATLAEFPRGEHNHG